MYHRSRPGSPGSRVLDCLEMRLSRPEKYAQDHSFRRWPARPLLWLIRGVVMKVRCLKCAAIDLFENIYYDSAKST